MLFTFQRKQEKNLTSFFLGPGLTLTSHILGEVKKQKLQKKLNIIMTTFKSQLTKLNLILIRP